jgi:hypothetical protein
VSIAKPMDRAAIEEREAEEQVVIEATIRARGVQGTEQNTQCATEFGSSLAQNEHVALMRMRSSSVASDSLSAGEACVGDIAALAMTPEERAILEEEMKQQHNHPLAQRLQQEQEERRIQNEREYYRTQTGRLRELRARRELLSRTLGESASFRRRTRDDPAAVTASRSSSRSARDWNRIVEAFDSNGSGNAQSLDDLVVLEAAIMLSMEEETRRREAGTGQINEDASGNDVDDDSSSDAAEHAGDGFSMTLGWVSARSAEDDTGISDLSSHMSSIMRTLHNRRHGGRVGNDTNLSAQGQRLDTDLATDALLMSGMSDDEQLAMAIAASLAEQGNSGGIIGELAETRFATETDDVASPTISEEIKVAHDTPGRMVFTGSKTASSIGSALPTAGLKASQSDLLVEQLVRSVAASSTAPPECAPSLGGSSTAPSSDNRKKPPPAVSSGDDTSPNTSLDEA